MARKGPQNRVSLGTRLAWQSTLLQAFVEVTRRANLKSAGPDNVTVGEFRRDARSQIKRLQSELREGNYKPSLPRGVAIPKDKKRGTVKGNVRSISVFNVRDRIIQRAISNLIWPRLRSHVHSRVSFGGIRRYTTRKGREKTSTDVRKNVKAAAERILTLKRDGHTFLFETDIRDFYPSIKKERLLSNVLECLTPDESLADLLERAIDTTVVNFDDLDSRGLSEYWDAMQGVPQGGVLSPLFANFYLASFDKALVEEGFQPVRYVDDLVVPTRTLEEAEKAYQFCKRYLASLDLAIHDLNKEDAKGRIKTRVRRPDQHVDFLGLRFEGH